MKARHKDTGEIIQLAEEGVISSDGRRFCWYQVELLPEPIDEFQPSLPSNLDEAADNHIRKVAYTAGHPGWDWTTQDIADAFKAGAKWMEKQGVYAYCIESSNPVSESPDIKHHCITLEYEESENTPYVRAGDRVEVVLRKI